MGTKQIDVESLPISGSDAVKDLTNSRCLSRLERWATALSIETGGIERITDQQRQTGTTHAWNACTFWLSANFAVATLSCGMVGPSMGLSFWESFIVIIIVNVFSCMLPAWTATFGLTGLRMTTFSRYSFGYWGNLLVVIFSILSTTGWNAINSISGASCLVALSSGTVPPYAGVILITTVVWIICIFGISWIHRIDTFIWIPSLVVWCVAAGTGTTRFNDVTAFRTSSTGTPASVLSFIAVVFSFAVSWVNCAADYNVKMPVNTPRWKIFSATYIGIVLPTICVQSLGVALYIAASLDPVSKHSYARYGVGGPLAATLVPIGGFGKFLMVLAALSAIPNNIPNQYSFALHAQNFGPRAIQVPRLVFITLGYVAAITVGCLASLSFASSLQTVLSIVGYWTVIHLVVVAEEHIIFRRCNWSSYDLDAWNKPALLTFGWAAICAFGFGFLGAVLGMKVTWYAGPIARLIGRGANIGHELAFGFSAMAFPIFRYWEYRSSARLCSPPVEHSVREFWLD